MPISGPGHFSPVNRRGGRWVDSYYNRFVSKTRKDPKDLKLNLKKFYFLDVEEEQSPESIQRILPAGEAGAAGSLWPEEELEDEDTDNTTGEKDDEFFVPDDEFIYSRVKKVRPKTDYEASITSPRPTTQGLGTGRLSARQRFSSGPYNNNYPAGNISEKSEKELRKLIKYEIIKNYDKD